MDRFLSCDWGTSSFRLRLVENGRPLEEIKSEKGISVIFNEWKKEQQTERLDFYQSYLLQQVKSLQDKLGFSLDQIPLILSGMASSSIGMIELSYKLLPFKTDGSDLEIKTIKASRSFSHQLIIISGVRTGNDVLRGEETLLVGSFDEDTCGDSVLIFPGTHSKHLFIEDGWAGDFKTYMTGELFHLLSTKSILANSVEKNEFSKARFSKSFSDGVQKGSEANVLNTLFHVRTNQLFQKQNKEENYHYLSGLLMGAELKELSKQNLSAVKIVGNEMMRELYSFAFEVMGLDKGLQYQNDTDALIKGQVKICKAHLHRI